MYLWKLKIGCTVHIHGNDDQNLNCQFSKFNQLSKLTAKTTTMFNPKSLFSLSEKCVISLNFSIDELPATVQRQIERQIEMQNVEEFLGSMFKRGLLLVLKKHQQKMNKNDASDLWWEEELLHLIKYAENFEIPIPVVIDYNPIVDEIPDFIWDFAKLNFKVDNNSLEYPLVQYILKYEEYLQQVTGGYSKEHKTKLFLFCQLIKDEKFEEAHKMDLMDVNRTML